MADYPFKAMPLFPGNRTEELDFANFGAQFALLVFCLRPNPQSPIPNHRPLITDY
jgi:hypothetical protein